MTESANSAEPPANRLATSTSPYLRQHAHNPVDWYPWGPEALERAAREDKPILLSVGYSACHWCHVMAHESFEDPETAALMNERFVNIKVDREERPDIDAIYQKVVQMMGQGGGWPLTVFLTPDGRPFFGGTYFPPRPAYGRPSFQQVLTHLSDLYRARRDEIETQASAFVEGLERLAAMVDEEAPTSDLRPDAPQALVTATRALLSQVDPQWGGFGREPKFPNPTALELLLRTARGTGWLAQESGDAVRLTLGKMYQGGIYDHLRGGFARYSVDRVWLVPHFEKMLYDNAQLLPLYAEASVLWPSDVHLRRVAIETVEYLEADMRAPDGRFFSATDADSEGVEGKYYCWTPDEVAAAVGDRTLAETFQTVYGITESGNFEHGWSIPNLPRTLPERAADLGIDLDTLEQRLEVARARLLEHRARRTPPLRDEKVLTSWNALVVSGLARAAAAAESWVDSALPERWRDLALTVASRLCEAHVEGELDGTGPIRVMRAAFEGRVHTHGYLDDVAYLGRACLDLHELTLDPRWAGRAARLAALALEQYGRASKDGFYFTAADGEPLVERPESQSDGPMPSGLGVMVELLLRLDAAGLAEPTARGVVDRIFDRFRAATMLPLAYASLLTAAQHATPAAVHVTVRGPAPDDRATAELGSTVRTIRLRTPYPVSLAYETAEQPSAVVCRARVCTAPIADPVELRAAVERHR